MQEKHYCGQSRINLRIGIMTKQCKIYDKDLIGKFIDNELPEDQTNAISDHIKRCPLCQNLISQYNSINNIFEQNIAKQINDTDTSVLKKNILKNIRKNNNSFVKKLFDYLSPKFYLKIASIVTIMVTILIYFQTRPLGEPNGIKNIGPSAIVNSIDGKASSIMIFETKKNKQTIIWFSET